MAGAGGSERFTCGAVPIAERQQRAGAIGFLDRLDQQHLRQVGFAHQGHILPQHGHRRAEQDDRLGQELVDVHLVSRSRVPGVTKSSGVEVPKATTVIPIAKSEILKRRAMDAAPSTRRLAPFTSARNPSRKRT